MGAAVNAVDGTHSALSRKKFLHDARGGRTHGVDVVRSRAPSDLLAWMRRPSPPRGSPKAR